MKYRQIEEALFIDRPNRFIAHVLRDGVEETVHVKNTGRCKELLLPGAKVYLEKGDNPKRTTAFDLVAVQKGNRPVNMDSQAPNKVVEEWLYKKELFHDLIFVCPEKTYRESRFDFYVETKNEKVFIEVKGVTREQDGIVCFPDAPSERAIKHLRELMRAKKEGYRAIVLFVIQMEDVRYFTPDVERHPAFGDVLQEAHAAGVEVLAYDCRVAPDQLCLHQPVPVSLDGSEPGKNKEIFKNSEDFLKEIVEPLQIWYSEYKRDLPWRNEVSPYRVWVSEIMLQQTRVEAVKPYFARFLKALPNIRALAEAPEEELLKLWEGLGYYSRAKNLQAAAREIVEKYGGEMPGDYEKILGLKGIGSYTAGAISSIAFELPYPAVDGNVLRVLSRIRMDDRRIDDAKVKSAVEKELLPVMPKSRPGDLNQALMELGACVCLPNGAPRCEECPVSHLCLAYQTGTWAEYPRKGKGKPRRVEQKTVLVIRDEQKAAIHKRAAKGLLAGMYELPWVEGHLSPEEVIEYLAGMGLRTIRIEALRDAKHIFSHIEWHMKGYMVRVDELDPEKEKQKNDWVYTDPDEIERKYPIPSAFEAYTGYLNMQLGSKRVKGEKVDSL